MSRRLPAKKGKNRTRRRKPTKNPKPVVFIYCCGRTEWRYFKRLVKDLGIRSVSVDISIEPKDPVKQVQYSLEKLKKEQEDSIHKVFFVLDHDSFRKKINTAENLIRHAPKALKKVLHQNIIEKPI